MTRRKSCSTSSLPVPASLACCSTSSLPRRGPQSGASRHGPREIGTHRVPPPPARRFSSRAPPTCLHRSISLGPGSDTTPSPRMIGSFSGGASTEHNFPPFGKTQPTSCGVTCGETQLNPTTTPLLRQRAHPTGHPRETAVAAYRMAWQGLECREGFAWERGRPEPLSQDMMSCPARGPNPYP